MYLNSRFEGKATTCADKPNTSKTPFLLTNKDKTEQILIPEMGVASIVKATMTKDLLTLEVDAGAYRAVMEMADMKKGSRKDSDRLKRDVRNIVDRANIQRWLALSQYDIRIMCENIAIKDDVIYLVLSIENNSAVSYAMSSPRFVIESKRKTKRGLVYEKQIFQKHCYGEGVTAPEKESRIVYSFDKVTLAKGQVFRIYFYSADPYFALRFPFLYLEFFQRRNHYIYLFVKIDKLSYLIEIG